MHETSSQIFAEKVVKQNRSWMLLA